LSRRVLFFRDLFERCRPDLIDIGTALMRFETPMPRFLRMFDREADRRPAAREVCRVLQN
jgi:hypothetical protein